MGDGDIITILIEQLVGAGWDVVVATRYVVRLYLSCTVDDVPSDSTFPGTGSPLMPVFQMLARSDHVERLCDGASRGIGLLRSYPAITMNQRNRNYRSVLDGTTVLHTIGYSVNGSYVPRPKTARVQRKHRKTRI